MSRNKQYQKLLNAKRWKVLRMEYLRQHPLCELCQAEGYVRAAVDVHHKIPVESAGTLSEMERLAYSWHNLQALCVPCHIKIHKDRGYHMREAHKQREKNRLNQWVTMHRK